MTQSPIGVGTIRRLGAMGEDGNPVLSVYLDLDPTRFPTPAAREMELESRIARRAGTAQSPCDFAGEGHSVACAYELDG